jgi:predicted MFS family arabinose efflux permease
VGVVAALLFVPRSRHLSARVAFDWTGFGLFVPTVAAAMFAISEGNHLGWTSPAVLVALVVAVGGVVSFVRWERRASGPLVDLTLFRRARFTSGVVGGMLAFAVLFGLLVVVPFELERGRGLGTVVTGLELMVLPVALGITAPFSGRVADRMGPRRPALAGLGVAAAALVLLAVLRPATPGFIALLAAVGVGMGLFVAPNNTAIMASVPPEQSGLASGLLNMTRGLGTALGLAVTTAVYGALAGPGRSGVDHGFSVSVLVLALGAVGALAVVAAGTRGEGGSEVAQDRVGDVGLFE